MHLLYNASSLCIKLHDPLESFTKIAKKHMKKYFEDTPFTAVTHLMNYHHITTSCELCLPVGLYAAWSWNCTCREALHNYWLQWKINKIMAHALVNPPIKAPQKYVFLPLHKSTFSA